MIQLSTIHANEHNPRTITRSKLAKLKKSLQEFGKMMSLRPLVVNESGMILGGNQRYHALIALGYTEVQDDWIKVADELTEEEQRRFIAEDNLPFGAWDIDTLANEYNFDELVEWGFDDWQLTGAGQGDDSGENQGFQYEQVGDFDFGGAKVQKGALVFMVSDETRNAWAEYKRQAKLIDDNTAFERLVQSALSLLG